MDPVINCVCPEQQKTLLEILAAPIITTLIGTIIGVFVGGYVTYRFGIRLADRNEFRIISGNLRRAFLDELLRLESQEDTDTYKILAPSLNKHQSAVFEFRQILARPELDDFDKAWKDYYYGSDDLDIPFLEQYADNGSLDKRGENRQIAINRIHKILSFGERNK